MAYHAAVAAVHEVRRQRRAARRAVRARAHANFKALIAHWYPQAKPPKQAETEAPVVVHPALQQTVTDLQALMPDSPVFQPARSTPIPEPVLLKE